FADRVGPRAVRALAGGAADRAADARRVPPLRLPAAGGVRRAAPFRDALSHCLPDRGAAAGLGRGDTGAPAAGAAGAAAGPSAARARVRRAARVAALGRKRAADRRARLRLDMGCSFGGRNGESRVGMRVAVLAPCWFPVPPTGYGGIEGVVSLLADGIVEG